ncbi:MAG TPA: hypothetical protein VF624_08175 [Tepidisphaeraceae bacterium]|jgi:hypothetical protein
MAHIDHTTAWVARVALAVVALAQVGCATYTTPGGPANLSKVNRTDVAEAFRREPAAQFPAKLAIVRLQQSGYRSQTREAYGAGNYSVLTDRDVETDDAFRALETMPQVRGLAPLNRIVLPDRLDDAGDLREAAAGLRADVLIMYTIGTTFRVDEAEIGPLGVITLGTLPNRDARVRATAAAAFVDVRTGFVYGLAEKSAEANERASAWRTRAAIDGARRRAEKDAFDALVPELQRAWAGITAEHARPPAAPPASEAQNPAPQS